MTAMQLELWRNLPVPPPRAGLRVWWPVSWREATHALLAFRQKPLRFEPAKRAPRIPVGAPPINPDALPYAVKPSKVIWMIQQTPPPKPLCFDTMGSWQEYLMYLHASGETITRRQDLGKNSRDRARVVTTVFDRIDFCGDCEIGGQRQRRMSAEGRCILPPKVTETLPKAAATA